MTNTEPLRWRLATGCIALFLRDIAAHPIRRDDAPALIFTQRGSND
jgi:hypothetical protein